MSLGQKGQREVGYLRLALETLTLIDVGIWGLLLPAIGCTL